MLREKTRCGWAGTDELYVNYHDTEWGVPVTDDKKLFEFLVLEGAQAGLSWITILRRREGYREAFDDFDVERVARFDNKKVAQLLKNTGIIRNRLKVLSAIQNAKAFIKVQDEFGSFSKYQWKVVGGKPIQNQWATLKKIPPRTDISDSWSKEMKKRGFSFVGSTILYAHMQAVGMVNDHIKECFRHGPVSKLSRSLSLR